MQKAESDSLIWSVSICCKGPRISHLFFTDGHIIFCNASYVDWGALIDLLVLYEGASGKNSMGIKQQFSLVPIPMWIQGVVFYSFLALYLLPSLKGI